MDSWKVSLPSTVQGDCFGNSLVGLVLQKFGYSCGCRGAEAEPALGDSR